MTYQPSPNVVSTTLDQEAVLLDLDTRRYYSLNETGARIWELLADDQSLDAIAEAITTEWDVSEENARAHVERLLSELEEEGLVERIQE